MSLFVIGDTHLSLSVNMSDASRSPRNATVQGEGASPYEDYRHRQQQRAQG